MKHRYLRMVRKMYRALRHPKLRHRGWWRKMTHPLFERRLWKPCRDTVATGLSVGMFFAVLPIPAQSLFAAIVAMRMRANVPFAMAACWLSNPFTYAPMWAAQLFLGNWVQKHFHLPLPEILSMEKNFPVVGTVHAGNFILGAIVLGLLLALATFPLIHLFSALLPHHLPVRKTPLKVDSLTRAGKTGAN
ncbi:DUF2062 domain-containing protein [Luteolibacter ambystomatis]|uniref:DUF2062 domain-containing protein n=1 Tax=Luteolibacter ambystomatis TaxID=2824561 RepID=A0A975G9M1_9BACT|nr:DUF2062 domain-containing protein [Luteolibacter ambystomatis]QUE50890.1 DUF2062 domain-containing protein [Luteolibacter ambystomatis]